MTIDSDEVIPVTPFQTCGSCRRQWDQWTDFVLDPEVRLIGFQAFPGLPDANLLVFEHLCGSSISILIKRLRHHFMTPGESTGLDSLFGTETCLGHCRYLEDLEACDRPCINARDRQLIRRLLEMRRNWCQVSKIQF